MKWIWRILLVLLLIPFFLPKEGSREIRSLPLLIAIVVFFALCILYRTVCLARLSRKVGKTLSESGYAIKVVRRGLYARFLIAENQRETLSVCLLLRKRRWYRYHFCSLTQIEFWVTSFWVATKNHKLGSVIGGAPFYSMLGGQRLDWPDTEGESVRFLVMDKMPNRVTDASPESGELSEGDALLGSEVRLLLPASFAEAVRERVQI